MTQGKTRKSGGRGRRAELNVLARLARSRYKVIYQNNIER